MGKNGLQGILLFPTDSMPRSVSGGVHGGNGLVIGRSRKGIHRPGHPVLKLSTEERDRV